MSQSSLSESLRATLLAITSIPSPIGEEGPLCDAIEKRLGAKFGKSAIQRCRDSLIVRAVERQGAPRVALVGHLDTVRTQHDGVPRIEGDRLYGPGAADMKSGLAVMIELAERLPRDALRYDLTLVFYEREEGPYEENMLGVLLEEAKFLRHLDLAICLEPSDNQLQLGCMGSIHAKAIFHGESAHSARPWQGTNAIYKSVPLLTRLSTRTPHLVLIDDLPFREVITPTLAQGGRGRNVVPDHFELNLNFRFAPTRTIEQAVEFFQDTVGSEAELVITDRAPAGHPHAHHPLIQHLTNCGVLGIHPKQAWTDVGRFSTIGVPAVNFGPGINAQAHQRNEYTELSLIDEGYAILERFLTT